MTCKTEKALVKSPEGLRSTIPSLNSYILEIIQYRLAWTGRLGIVLNVSMASTSLDSAVCVELVNGGEERRGRDRKRNVN